MRLPAALTPGTGLGKLALQNGKDQSGLYEGRSYDASRIRLRLGTQGQMTSSGSDSLEMKSVGDTRRAIRCSGNRD